MNKKIKFKATFNSPSDERLTPTKIKHIIKQAFIANGYKCMTLEVEKSYANDVDEKEIKLRTEIRDSIYDALMKTNLAKNITKDNGNIAKYKYVGLGFGRARYTDDSGVDYSSGGYRVLKIEFQPLRY